MALFQRGNRRGSEQVLCWSYWQTSQHLPEVEVLRIAEVADLPVKVLAVVCPHAVEDLAC